MLDNLITYFFTFIILLLGSAFFAGSEVAFFSLKPQHLNIISEKYKLSFFIISHLLKKPSQLLITILLCNTMVNVSIAIVAVYITMDIIKLTNANEFVSILIEIVVVTLILLVFGEITPKIVAKKYSITLSRFFSIPIFSLYILLFPLTKLLEAISSSVNNLFKVKTEKQDLSKLDLKNVIELVSSQKDIDSVTKEILKRVNEFSELTVKDVEIPRVKILAYEINSPIEKLYDITLKQNDSQIPVYEGNLDNIIGIIPVKKLLEYKLENKLLNSSDFKNIIEKPIYVPETKKIKEVLEELRILNSSLAIVVDEHGGVSGIVTKNIIIRTLFQTNDEQSVLSHIVELGDKEFLVNGETPITLLEQKLHQKLVEDNSNISTVAGWIFNYLGKIPKKGGKYKIGNLLILVEEIKQKVVNKVKILKMK